MTITVTLPEDLHSRPTGALTPRETRELLGFGTRYELDGFLKKHQVEEFAYDIADYEKDLAQLRK